MKEVKPWDFAEELKERHTDIVRWWKNEDLLLGWRVRMTDGHPPALTMECALESVRLDILRILETKPLESISRQARNSLAGILDYATYALMRHEIIARANELMGRERGHDPDAKSVEEYARKIKTFKYPKDYAPLPTTQKRLDD